MIERMGIKGGSDVQIKVGNLMNTFSLNATSLVLYGTEPWGITRSWLPVHGRIS